MAQHVPIDVFPQQSMKKMAEGIRNRHSFSGSFIWEELPEDYRETETDRVYFGMRTVPTSIAPCKVGIEVHTEPRGEFTHVRKVTDIYVVA